MARKKSELLSAVGRAFEILKAIVDEVLDLGGTDEDVRQILSNKNLRKQIASFIVQARPAIQTTFQVVVNYGQSLAEMISAGKYDWVNDEITQKHFPVKGRGQKQVEIVLFHFGKTMTSEQVIAEIDKQGYRPVKIEELLALNAGHPELQKEFPIVALGSAWYDPNGYRLAPFLYYHDVRRDLDLRWFGGGWTEDCRFAAVRK